MDYRERIRALMEQYYMLTTEYHAAAVDAAETARGRRVFRKADFSFCISAFRQLVVKAEKLNPAAVEIPSEDQESAELVRLMKRSITAFLLLCEASATYYDVTDRKQYRSNRVPLKEYADAANRMQGILEGAVKEMEPLEQAYREYSARYFACT